MIKTSTKITGYELYIQKMIPLIEDEQKSSILYDEYMKEENFGDNKIFYDEVRNTFTLSEHKAPFSTEIYSVKNKERYSRKNFIKNHHDEITKFINNFYHDKIVVRPENRREFYGKNVTKNRAYFYSYNYQLFAGRTIDEIFKTYKNMQIFYSIDYFTDEEYEHLLPIKEQVKSNNLIHYIHFDKLLTMNVKNIYYRIKLVKGVIGFEKSFSSYTDEELKLMINKINDLKKYNCKLELEDNIDNYNHFDFKQTGKNNPLIEKLTFLLNDLEISPIE